MLTIYQIYCKNPEITDCYVGSTKDFKVRASAHMSSCNNTNCKDHNMPVYSFIRNNGGFENWEFKILNQVEHYKELRNMQEQAYIDLIKPTLNKYNPVAKDKALRNKEAEKERIKKWRTANKNKINEKARNRYHEENDDKVSANRKFKEENKEEIIKMRKFAKAECDKKYREKNKDRLNLRKKEYYEKNKQHVIDKVNERRRRKKEIQASS